MMIILDYCYQNVGEYYKYLHYVHIIYLYISNYLTNTSLLIFSKIKLPLL
jgi:hypothetical protein